MMNVLLIGGTGVLSTAVTTEALKRGINITMINRGNNRGRIPQETNLIVSDKSNTAYIRKQLEGKTFDAVIDFLCFNENELESSFNLYSKFTKQYFFISSAGVYNNSIPGPCKEDHPKVQPLWPYSINKWKCEQSLVKLSKESDTHYTIIRPMITYDNTRIPYGIAPFYGYHWTLVERILHNKPIITWNNGENRCNMMRVEDFATALVGLIGNANAFDEVFNICGDETPSFKEVLDIVGGLVHRQVATINIDSQFYAKEYPGRAGEILGGRAITTIIDNSKLKQVVPDFKQRISIGEGIEMTLDAYKANNYFKGIDWEFEATTDKTIYKWCKLNHIDMNDFNVSFINYFGSATLKNRLDYYMMIHGDSFLIKKWKDFELWLRQTAYKHLKKKGVK
ncbi:MAG: NAD-dependent epimerase/dehydratase family protein [Muribaculaceae bacterium]|nr:NAD-dependent epimerase/dehydratase family protein [Muribaculaceae bacterium]